MAERYRVAMRTRMGPIGVALTAALAISACGQLGGDEDEAGLVDVTSQSDDQGQVSASTVGGDTDPDSNTDDSNTDGSDTDGSNSDSDSDGGDSGDSDGDTDNGESDDYCPGSFQRIVFAEGAFDGTVDGTLENGRQAFHPIGVVENQIMTISLSSSGGATFDLVEPDGKIIVGGFTDLEVTETTTGDYGICVTAPNSDPTDYSLTVTAIWDNTPTKVDASWCGDAVNDRGEIKFDPGAFSGTVENSVIRGERDLYRVGAGDGQFLVTELNSLENNAEFMLRDPEGTIIVNGATDFRFSLAGTGDYEFCVGGTRGNATYLLYVEIS